MEQSLEYKRLSFLLDNLHNQESWEFMRKDKLFRKIWSETKDIYNFIYDVYSKMRLIQIPRYHNIPCGYVKITIEEFINNCKDYKWMLCDDKEYMYATEDKMTDIHIYPEDVYNKNIRQDFAYIVYKKE